MAKRRSWADWFPIAAKPRRSGFKMSDAEYERLRRSVLGIDPQAKIGHNHG